MTADDHDKEATEEEETTALSSPGDGDSLSKESKGESGSTGGGGVTRTILLAVPLFCKFVIVLMIKFLTDLVVFPLLFLYRLARITKRKILAIFSFGKTGDKKGGPTSSSSVNGEK